MTTFYPSSPSTSRSLSRPLLSLSSSLLVLSLVLALLLPSSLAIPISPSRSDRDNIRRGPQHANHSPPPSSHLSSTDAQSDLTPNGHSHATPIPSNPIASFANPRHALHSDPHSPVISSPTDAPFTPGAGAADDSDHSGHGKVQAVAAPSRIRAQPQEGGLYAAQKKAKRQHEHNSHDDEAVVSESASGESCLTAEELRQAKKDARAKLLTVMEQYLAAWQAEEKSDDEIEKLYDEKKDELKIKLTAKKHELTARACPDAREAAASKPDSNSSARRLMGLEDDDWLDQEEDTKVYLIEENSTTSAEEDSPTLLDDDDQVGAVAHIVAGGSRRVESEDNDAPRFDASVHPFAMPSAFTSLSERDIEAIHSPSPPPPPKAQPVSPATEHDIGEIAFVASISPSRYSPVPLDNPPVIVVGQRSQRDMDEDLEEERRRRRERLKEIRSRSANNAPATMESDRPVPRGSLPLSDEELPPGGFVASISPMAPQHTSPLDYDEDGEAAGRGGAHAYIGSISAPSLNGGGVVAGGGGGGGGGGGNGQRGGMSLEERWRREEEEERKTEEGGGVWRSGSRGRLERTVGRGRQG